MQTIEFGQKLNTPVVICLGFFGCVHNGHQAILQKAAALAENSDARIALFTFRNGKSNVKQLFTFDERLELYKNVGVDVVVYADFDADFAATKGGVFVQKLLDSLNVCGVCCGFDYTFGCDRLCAEDLLAMLPANIQTVVADCVSFDGTKIATSNIYDLVASGRVEQANRLLAEPFFFQGKVVHGRHVGTDMGFPTANVTVGNDKLLPCGVFAGITTVDEVEYRCIVNIGAKPTFGIESSTVEAHLIDFDGNLYGQTLKVQLTRFLRETRAFSSEKELEEQLSKDKKAAML